MPEHISPSPALLALQQLPVGGDLHVQGQLQAHELLVLPQHPGQLLLGLVQGRLQLVQLGLGILQGIVSTLLSIGNGRLQVRSLNGELEKLENLKRSLETFMSKYHSFFEILRRVAHLYPSHSLLFF